MLARVHTSRARTLCVQGPALALSHEVDRTGLLVHNNCLAGLGDALDRHARYWAAVEPVTEPLVAGGKAETRMGTGITQQGRSVAARVLRRS